jgi:hypothetical protein
MTCPPSRAVSVPILVVASRPILPRALPAGMRSPGNPSACGRSTSPRALDPYAWQAPRRCRPSCGGRCRPPLRPRSWYRKTAAASPQCHHHPPRLARVMLVDPDHRQAIGSLPGQPIRARQVLLLHGALRSTVGRADSTARSIGQRDQASLTLRGGIGLRRLARKSPNGGIWSGFRPSPAAARPNRLPISGMAGPSCASKQGSALGGAGQQAERRSSHDAGTRVRRSAPERLALRLRPEKPAGWENRKRLRRGIWDWIMGLLSRPGNRRLS